MASQTISARLRAFCEFKDDVRGRHLPRTTSEVALATRRTPSARRAIPLIRLAAIGCMLVCAQPGSAAEVKDYGKQGTPIEMVVGYQPYYTQSWSGVIMRSKKFYEKYLPAGSKVDFKVGLQGAIIVKGMLAGTVELR